MKTHQTFDGLLVFVSRIGIFLIVFFHLWFVFISGFCRGVPSIAGLFFVATVFLLFFVPICVVVILLFMCSVFFMFTFFDCDRLVFFLFCL